MKNMKKHPQVSLGDDDDVLTLASSVGFQTKESALKATSSMLLMPVNTSL